MYLKGVQYERSQDIKPGFSFELLELSSLYQNERAKDWFASPVSLSCAPASKMGQYLM